MTIYREDTLKISDNSKKLITKEFGFITKRMKESETALEKLYYFSGSYGLISRILNFEFDPSLVLIHQVLQTSHATLNQTVRNITTGQERVIILPEILFEKLGKELQQLGKTIEKNGDFGPILENISNLTFIATGNGYYLYQRGDFKI